MFPDNRTGINYQSIAINPRWSGYWGNVNQVGGLREPRSAPQWSHNRSPLVRGDRVHATPYHRRAGVLVSDEPVHFEARGSDGNGAWKHEEWYYMSAGLPPWVLDPYDIRDTAYAGAVGNLRSKVLTGLTNKIVDQKINFGENIGQATQTVEGILQPFIALTKAYLYARKGNWAGVQSILGKPREYFNGQKIAQGWLSYYYGWKPLVSDIYAGIDLLKNTQPLESKPQKFTKTGSTSDRISDRISGGYTNDISWEARIKASVTLTANSSIGGLLNSIGLHNPLATAYELTPLSFVVDWFIPVGSFLTGLSAGSGFDFVTGSVTTKELIIHKAKARTGVGEYGYYPNGTPWKVLSAGNRETHFSSIDRSVLYSVPLPRLYARENPFTTERMASAMSLIRQLF